MTGKKLDIFSSLNRKPGSKYCAKWSTLIKTLPVAALLKN
jgi:hypothetical protein